MSVHALTYAEDALEPLLAVTDKKSGEILVQVFNMIDTIGGKQAISVESKLHSPVNLLQTLKSF